MTDSGQLSVYPSVAKDKITIANKESGTEVSIYDQVGKLVLTSSDSEINISTLNTGLYLLNIQGKVMKFIKE